MSQKVRPTNCADTHSRGVDTATNDSRHKQDKRAPLQCSQLSAVCNSTLNVALSELLQQLIQVSDCFLS